MGEVVDQVSLKAIKAFGALDGKKRVPKATRNEKHHHDAQGEGPEHLAKEVSAEFGKMHTELKGSERNRIPLLHQGVIEGFRRLQEKNGLPVTVVGSIHGLCGNALFIERQPEQGIHGQSL